MKKVHFCAFLCHFVPKNRVQSRFKKSKTKPHHGSSFTSLARRTLVLRFGTLLIFVIIRRGDSDNIESHLRIIQVLL